jgi:endoglucanase
VNRKATTGRMLAIIGLVIFDLPGARGASAEFAPSVSAPAPQNAEQFAVRVDGNRLVDAQRQTLRLRGVNVSALEFTHVKGFPGPDGWGGQKPSLKAIKAWGANVIRVPLNEASYLGHMTYDWPAGSRTITPVNPDPSGRYRQIVRSIVDEAVAQNLYVILDLHWNAPKATVPGQARPVAIAPRADAQNEMADVDHALDFWRTLATEYRNYPAVIFELYNEPHIDNFEVPPGTDWGSAAWKVLRDGGVGRVFYGADNVIRQRWRSAGMQEMLDAVRGTGATNVVLSSGIDWAKDISRWVEFAPRDPLRQLGAVWHVYPPYNSEYGRPDYAQPARGESGYGDAERILKAGFPLLITETGDHSATGTRDAPLMEKLLPWADRKGISVLGWTWNAWGAPEANLIKDAAGTPTDGYGQFFRKWMSGVR